MEITQPPSRVISPPCTRAHRLRAREFFVYNRLFASFENLYKTVFIKVSMRYNEINLVDEKPTTNCYFLLEG